MPAYVDAAESATVTAAEIARMAGVGRAAPNISVEIRTGDSPRVDAFTGVEVDAVLCEPPFGDHG